MSMLVHDCLFYRPSNTDRGRFAPAPPLHKVNLHDDWQSRLSTPPSSPPLSRKMPGEPSTIYPVPLPHFSAAKGIRTPPKKKSHNPGPGLSFNDKQSLFASLTRHHKVDFSFGRKGKGMPYPLSAELYRHCPLKHGNSFFGG